MFQSLNHVYSGHGWNCLTRFRIFEMADNMCRKVVSIVTRIKVVQVLKHVYYELIWSERGM